MDAGAFGERLDRLAGPGFLSRRPDFDASKALHVDEACQALLTRFFAENDGQAFELLVDLATPHLQRLAERAMAEHGLLADGDQLIGEWLGLIFVDMDPVARAPEHLLAEAGRWFDGRVPQLIEAIAARPLPHEDGYDEWCASDEGQLCHQENHREVHAEEVLNDPRYMDATSVAFHRLDRTTRRVMRAMDVDYRLPEDIAEQLGLSEKRVLQAMDVARGALLAATSRIDGGHHHD